ncbi:unnamed protein product, partial [Rotaria sp. Silwood1]
RQAIRALKEEKIYTLLLNPNASTHENANDDLHKLMFLPTRIDNIQRMIKRFKLDGILLSFSGQTALDSGIKLHETDFLQSERCNALTSAKQFGYPVLVRAASSFDVCRSRFVSNLEELIPLVNSALAQSSQLLICKSLKGWKKVEYEVVRDQYDNCIMVCNRENIDPTAPLSDQSIVVVPSQTLSSDEFNLLRSISIKVVRHLGIVGQCNVQFALNPLSVEYYIIKVNIRLTRSSALASRVTGYPLGYITTKLALGMSLIDLKNHITYETYSCFEPTLDCIAIKIPPWDLKQFVQCSHQIGSSMKSIEVVAISRSFEEAFQKCLRMVDENFSGFESYERTITDDVILSKD